MLVRLGKTHGLKVRGRTIFLDSEGTGLNGHGTWRNVRYNFGTEKKPDWEDRRVMAARPFAYSFCDRDGNTDYIRWRVNPMTREVDMDKRADAVARLLDDPTITIVGHNIRHDVRASEQAGFRVRARVLDTQILAHTMTAGDELTYALKPLTKKYTELDDLDEKALAKSTHQGRRLAKKKRWAFATEALGGRDPWKADYWLADHALCKDYAVYDAVRCALLHGLWYDDCMKDALTRSVLQREHKLFWVLKKMEDRGTRVHPEIVNNKLTPFYEDYKQEQVKIAEANGGKGLNYGSTPQMSKAFYDTRGHLPEYTGTYNEKLGRFNYSLNGEQLLKMANGYSLDAFDMPDDLVPKAKVLGWRYHKKTDVYERPPDPLAKAVLEFKAAHQTISSFLDVYKRHWVRESRGVWVLHPNYRQTGTVTGRLSCSDPNLMQVASATTGRRKADIQSRPREAFGPRPGHVWYLPDYSQIEVWLFAFMSGEKRMQRQLLAGRDYHGGIAKQVFGAREDFAEHAEYYRKCAKLIMFAKLYGGGLDKLASLLKMSKVMAAEFIEDYERRLPGVKRFMDEMIELAETEGEIVNAYGRRYRFEPRFAYRAVNYMIQGTAADVMKNALINVNTELENNWDDAPRLLLTIHDEVIVEVPEEYHSVELMQAVIRAMQQDQKLLGLPVPLPVEMKLATTFWHEAKKVKFLKAA